MFSFDEKKILFAKKLLISNPNRGVYSDVFNDIIFRVLVYDFYFLHTKQKLS